MKIREYSLLIGGGAVCLALTAVAVFLLVRFSEQYRQVAAELRSQTGQLEELQRRTPFPNETNVQRTAENLDLLQAGYDRLIADLSRAQTEPPSIEPPQWSLLYQRVFGALDRRAADSTILRPERFRYGFERYAAGNLPARRHLPRLVRQAGYVEMTCRLLLDAKVHAIRDIQRHVFEDEVTDEDPWAVDAGVRREARVTRGRRPRTEADRDAVSLMPGYFEHPDSLYARERMVFSFSVREPSLWQILDALARAETLSVVSRIHVRNPTPRPGRPREGSPLTRPAGTPRSAAMRWAEDMDPDMMDFEGAPVTRPATPRGEGEEMPLAGVPRQDRIAAGRDDLLEVTLEIEFYHFKGSGQHEEATL